MPIKKRGGNGESFNIKLPKKSKPIAHSGNKSVIEKKSVSVPKPQPKLTNLKRRQPMSSDYVYTDGGVLVIKTPAVTGKWDSEFRLRIIRDYVAPQTMFMINVYNNRYVNSGIQETIYKIAGKKLQVHYPHEPIVNSANTVVLRTDVINQTDRKRLFLNHDEPAMRVLMVYCFLTGKKIGGVPKLIVDEYPPA